MKSKHGDEMAFPICDDGILARGLTKREFFAAAAMKSLCRPEDTEATKPRFRAIGDTATLIANATLAALEKEPETEAEEAPE